jgi:hypothetical protein
VVSALLAAVFVLQLELRPVEAVEPLICSDCHANQHDNTALTYPACGECHVDNVVLEHNPLSTEDCWLCHVSSDPLVTDAVNRGMAGETIYCDDCHGPADHSAAHDMTDVDDVSCADCHDGNVQIEHVEIRGLACSVCHDSTDPTILDAIDRGRLGEMIYCSDCHGGSMDHALVHDMTFLPQIECSDCHVDNVEVEHTENRGVPYGTCHDSTDPAVLAAIDFGMQGQAVYCGDCHQTFVDHAADHDATVLPQVDCGLCHEGNVEIEHTENRGLLCAVCHESTDPAVLAAIDWGMAGQLVYCGDCHQLFSDHDVDHDMTLFPAPECGDCHVANAEVQHAEQLGLACAVCHDSSDPDVAAAVAHGMEGNPVYCADCHTIFPGHGAQHDATALPLTDCAACHEANVEIEHTEDRGLACVVCHESTDLAVQDAIAQGMAGQTVYCADCHQTFANHGPGHDMTAVPGPQCATCHVDNVEVLHFEDLGIPCASCHESTIPTIQDAIAQGMAGQTVYCTDCHQPFDDHGPDHDATFVPAADCALCHEGNVEVEHTENRGLICTVCHESTDPVVQAAIDDGMQGNPVYCADCHTAFDDHGTGHDMTVVPETLCLSCHVENVEVEHTENRGLPCATCHDSADPAVQDAIAQGMAGQTVSCTDCHSAFGGHGGDHDMTILPAPECGQCHEANVEVEHYENRGIDCAVCHDSSDPAVLDAIARGSLGEQIPCSDCHAGFVDHSADHDSTALPETSCGQCHEGNVEIEHFENRGIDCAVCHDSTDPAVQDAIARGMQGITVYCADCHDGSLDHSAQHDMTRVPETSCLDCHEENVEIEHTENRGILCAACHESTDPAVLDAIAQGMAGQEVYCGACHAGAVDHTCNHEVANNDCTACHQLNLQPEHDNLCATCHESTDPQVVQAISTGQTDCTACHSADTHTTRCSNCHTDKQWEDYIGRGREVHDRHMGKVSCGVCHSIPSDPQPTEQCGVCHSPRSPNNLPEVHKRHAKKIKQTPYFCAMCHGRSVPAHQSTDCSLCHTNKQYPRDWSTSTHQRHGKKFDCTGCHQVPADFTFDTNNACNRCHDDPGGSPSAQEVHSRHFGKSLCWSCHGSNDVAQFTSDFQCASCHGGTPQGSTTSVHKRHAGKLYQCWVCHSALESVYSVDDFNGVSDCP